MGERIDYENRSYSFDVRSDAREDGIATLSGRPIVYSRATDIGGWFEEIIEPGALDGADLTDVPLLVNHNERMIPVARSRRNTKNSTLRLAVDGEGLTMEADVDIENNATSRELNSAVTRGDIDGMSFRFAVSEQRWEKLDTDYPTRHILKFSKIGEISAVTWPAYDATSIYARSKEALESARAELESVRQQQAKPVETGDLELEKQKLRLLTQGVQNA